MSTCEAVDLFMINETKAQRVERLKREKCGLDVLDDLARYAASGEINSTVADSEAVLNRIREKYTDGKLYELDGVSVDYEDWWFNVRCSNTEPLVRLNLEAHTQEKMAEKRDELLALIRG